MTEAEARIFLGYEPEDELEDVIEDKLFEFKQFFLSKPIIWSTFKADHKAIVDLIKDINSSSGISGNRYPLMT